ncbi:hypothetical protein L1049_000318 [Liquidambar formosana]|uniref:Gag1-like clamp domain-containing protein n=1 Tax=Liquidambar formosana TaxID=63359 RepID=A0AAP0NCJ7_LIQFO
MCGCIYMMILSSSITTWIGDFLACMGGCLGCYTKPGPIIAVDEPSKGLRIRGRTVKKPSVSEDFWSTSTCDMENSTFQSHGSISSISTSNQTLSHSSGTGSTGSHSEFTNHGLLLWNQTRLQWRGSGRYGNGTQQIQEPRLSWNATYENLLGTNKRFSQPVPLAVSLLCNIVVWISFFTSLPVVTHCCLTA